ncbi:hypothetical protein N182_34770 [Sinorhizobium sp. GL2]|nr:hypothetical protein N182_34770 [Sinorhizobium sp. GL2]
MEEAQAILSSQADPIGTERVPIGDAGFRILAEPVFARIDSPRETVAAMDGFAVAESDVQAGCVTFKLAGASYPGGRAVVFNAPSTAARVTTGAPLSASKQRVIPFELVEETQTTIRLAGPLPTQSHIRHKASGFETGQLVLPRGTCLDPARLLVAAASDNGDVLVHRRPRVRVITNGSELVGVGLAAETDSRVPDSLSLPLLLLARQWGADTAGGTLCPDFAGAIRKATLAALGDCDVLVIAGGASNGDYDLARPVLRALGLVPLFAGVAIKPGKPVWYGKVGGVHVLGLPGNPAAAMTTARLFLAPLLSALAGRSFAAALDWQERPLATPAEAADPARDMALFGHRGPKGGITILPRQSASVQLPLANAEVLVRRPAGGPALPEGTPVPVLDL